MKTDVEADARPRRGTRADALRNRARIMSAAGEVFAEHGPDAAFDEVARRAGIGNATVYRHFADRDALLYEVVLGVVSRVADEAEWARAEESDPFAAVGRFVHVAADERIAVLCPLLSGRPAGHGAGLSAAKERVARAADALVTAAQEAGRLRADVTSGDLLMALAQLTRPLPGEIWSDLDRFAHRNLQIYLDGLATPTRSTLLAAQKETGPR